MYGIQAIPYCFRTLTPASSPDFVSSAWLSIILTKWEKHRSGYLVILTFYDGLEYSLGVYANFIFLSYVYGAFLKMDIQVVIITGGLATRLGELTKNRPKSMVEVLSRPFLAYQLELLKDQEITDIVLCIGHLGTQIKEFFRDGSKYGVHIRYSVEDKLLGTAGALKNAEPMLDNIFFVMYGDSYLFLDFPKIYSYFISQNKLGLATIFKNHDAYDQSNMVINGNMVTKYNKVEKSNDMVYIDYGASIFKKEALQLIPEKHVYSLEDLFIRLIEKKQLLAFEVKDRFYEIGSPQGLKDFKVFSKGKLKR